MGHRISALIAKSPIMEDVAEKYDFPVFPEGDFVIIGLYPSHADYWDEKLGFKYEKVSDILMDTKCTHFLAKELGLSKFAIIFTDYFGGIGYQLAAVYEGGKQTMPPTKNGINKALKILGVYKSDSKDEFDSINLGKYRDFDDYFEKYEDL
jgi:hypothetical protein